jgi:hypothetical protein
MSTPVPRLNLSTISVTPEQEQEQQEPPNRRMGSDDVIWSQEGRAMGGGAATPPGSHSPSPSRPLPRTNAHVDPGDFRLAQDGPMLKNMYDAITTLNLWDWLSAYEPPADKGFMFAASPELNAIATATDAFGHSGASFALCMRHMECIAKEGWIDYCRTHIYPQFAK